MEFDKSRVYTAVNAEELPAGSKCIFADSLEIKMSTNVALTMKIQHTKPFEPGELFYEG